jgi:hypothetical protein
MGLTVDGPADSNSGRSLGDWVKAAAIIGGFFLAFALGVFFGKDIGRTNMIFENLERDRATQAWVDCIILRGKDACPQPPELSQ